MLSRTALALSCLTYFATVQASTSIKLPNDPAVSPDAERVAFSWNGDLWDARINRGVARRLTFHDADDRQPVYSRNGRQMAFVSDRTGSSQVYVMPAGGGQPRQVTFHTEGYQVHDWFPDGESLLCTGGRDHHWRDTSRMVRVWIDGSRGEQVLTDATATAPSLSADGKHVLFSREAGRWWRKGYRGAGAGQVWMLDLESGQFTKLLHEDVDCLWPVWSHDGAGFYFAKGDSEGFDLWHASVPMPPLSEQAAEVAQQLDTKRVLDVDTHSVVFPAVSANKPVMIYRHGFDLYQWDTQAAGAPKKINLRTKEDAALPEDLARRKLQRASEIAFHADGLEIAFIAGGDIWVMDTELREPVQVTQTPEHETNLVWGPEGDSLWFVSTRGVQADIFRVERKDDSEYWWRTSEFDVTQLTDDGEVESRLRFDPTGERLLYVRGNGELWVRDVESGETRKLIGGFDSPDYDISPDGRWLAYSQENDNFNSEVFLMPIDGSQPPFNVSRHPDNDMQPCFSSDGKVLAFTGRRFEQETDIFYVYLQNEQDEKSSRDRKLEEALEKFKKERSKKKRDRPENDERDKLTEEDGEKTEDEEQQADEDDEENKPVEPIEIDLEGLDERLRRIRLPGVNERRLVWIGKDQRLAFEAEIEGKEGYYTIELPEELKPKLLTKTTGTQADWSSEAEALFLNAGGKPTKVDLEGETTNFGFSVVQEYSRSQRFAHGFDVAWRTMRDRWYDERLGGKNWDLVRRRYRHMAAEAIDTGMLRVVVEMMLGELNGSHLGFRPVIEDSYEAPPHPDRTAHLGLRFDPSYQGPGLKVRDVLPGGPTDREGVDIEPGDLLLEIDGKSVDPAAELTNALNGRLDRDVRLTIKKIEADETFEWIVRPTTFSKARELLYTKWLDDSRGRVHKLSDGKLGYLHIRRMDMDSFTEFERQLYAAGNGKQGLVIDVRDNGGGWTTDLLLTAVTQPRHAITIPRGGGRGYPQDRRVFATWHKPIVVLCNQNSFSNAEIFSHAIKTLGRGKLVGVPTAGGVISTGSAQVTDVGRMRLPFRGWFVLGTGQDMELNGAVPDVILWPAPGELPAGIDRQLERAVELLLEEVATEPEGPVLKYVTEQPSSGEAQSGFGSAGGHPAQRSE